MDRLTWLMSCLLVDACGMRVSRGDSGVFCWGKDSYQAFSCIRLGEILTSPSGILKLHFTSHEGLAEGDLKPKSGNFLALPWSRAQPHVGWNVDKCRGWIFYIVYGCQGWQDDKKSPWQPGCLNKPTLPSFGPPGSHPFFPRFFAAQTVAVAQEIATGKYTNPLIPRWDFGKVQKNFPEKFSWKRNNWGVFWVVTWMFLYVHPDKIQIDTTYIEKTGSLKGIFW